jgi:molecular chaperone GrpE
MRKQRFPFLISPFERRADADGEMKEKSTRMLASLSLIESSLEELLEKTDSEGKWLDFFRSLIPILDGIDALRDAIESGGDPSWKKGMEILSGKISALLETQGFLRTARVGMAFDPARHEAVGAEEASPVSPGDIAEVVENGWHYRGKILRYAKVVVAKGGS